MKDLADLEVVKLLGSRDRQEANAAVSEIMNRSEAVLELLLRLRGDQSFFEGTAIRNPRSSILLPVPTEGFPLPDSERDRVVTVEAAALYMISAFFHEDVHFSRAPLFVDMGEPREKRKGVNTQERVNRAYQAVDAWVIRCKEVGIGELRARGENPLLGSGLKWL